jgi:hypothetical protein
MPSWLLRWFFQNEHSDPARYLLVVEFDENMRLTLRTFNSGFDELLSLHLKPLTLLSHRFAISSTIIVIIKVLVSGAPSPQPAPAPGAPTPTPPPSTPALFPYPLTITTAIQLVVFVLAVIASRIPYCGVVNPTRQQVAYWYKSTCCTGKMVQILTSVNGVVNPTRQQLLNFAMPIGILTGSRAIKALLRLCEGSIQAL